MADPDWIGAAVKDAYWSADGRAVYYSAKRGGSPIVDLHRVDLAGGKDQAGRVDRIVEAKAMAGADAAAVFDASGKRAAFARNGDIFVRDLASGRLTQITRTPENEAAPQFSADGRLLSFRVNNDWFVHDFDTGVTTPAAVVEAEKDPDAPPKPDVMRDMQMHTFSTLKRLHDESQLSKKYAEEFRQSDITRAAAPFYLGEDVSIRDTELSPDARWLVIVTAPKSAAKGFEGKLTRYVTESGYEELETERQRVGRNPPAPQSLMLLNLVDHTAHALSVDALPGIDSDPLKAIREENGIREAPADAPVRKDAKPKRRAVSIVSEDPDGGAGGIVWSRDGKALAVQVLSADNKDRWIASVDFANYVLVPQHRLTDPAWINWTFNDFGWLADNRTLWFESEETGYAHLYTKAPNAEAQALTQGRFEVSDPALSADGRWFYVLSNAAAPYSYDVYRVPSAGGKLQRVTQLQGLEKFTLDQHGRNLLVTHSTPYMRAQIAVLKADGSGAVRDVTDTGTAAYKAISWNEPEIVRIPSTHADGVIYAKVYRAPAPAPAPASAPAPAPAAAPATRSAVIFIHGAGYLQNVHLRYPYYFREQMFNSWLAQKGYVVLDLDYRASAGYGRDWRTAIYRQMGHPELEDLLDGKKWLTEQAAVDPKRVGVYGGSYGGFMTLMALFRAPGEFAAGAALRPVTDWMQYEHNYTSAILNDPQVDPIAYARSSPIEFADGLRDPLLICHGVIDDNVLFEDSMRLYQRLIELHKDDFTMSPYPMDRHGFSNADSWLDEYKRIYRLFEAHLQ
jgi:dipeptidyl aminopeptidase/acylaminoacyl peptidase